MSALRFFLHSPLKEHILIQFALGIALLTSASGGAQTVEANQTPEQAAEETPIVVTGSNDDADAATFVVGSRIQRKPRYREYEHNFRTRTGLGGLGPGSGMNPMSLQNPRMLSQVSSCTSDNAAIRSKAACLLLSAREHIEEGNIQSGADIYRFLTSSGDFAPQERRTAGEELYRLGHQIEDNLMREEALLRLVESASLPPERSLSARRSLVTLAIKRKDYASAISRSQALADTAPKDAQNLANLAILLRQQGMEGASARMAQAIAAQESNGKNVPDAWRAF